MTVPFSASGQLSPQEAIDFRKHEVRLLFPVWLRVLFALLAAGLAAWLLESYMNGPDVTPVYAGIAVCLAAPFALVWLYDLVSLAHYRLLRPRLPESSVTIDTDGVEISSSDVTIRCAHGTPARTSVSAKALPSCAASRAGCDAPAYEPRERSTPSGWSTAWCTTLARSKKRGAER